MIEEDYKIPHLFWNLTSARRIRRCTNYVKSGNPTLKRELVRRCGVQPMIEEGYRILNVGLLLSTLYIFSIFGAQIDYVAGK